MTPKERASLAEQLEANPLFEEIMSNLESNAVERMIYAEDDETRLIDALRVQAVRSFRSDCQSAIDSTRERRGGTT